MSMLKIRHVLTLFTKFEFPTRATTIMYELAIKLEKRARFDIVHEVLIFNKSNDNIHEFSIKLLKKARFDIVHKILISYRSYVSNI